MGDIIHLAGRGRRPTILLVESETLLRVDIAGALRKCDFVVVEAVNGDEALALLRSGRMAHAMLSALHLDGALSGPELAEAVQCEFPSVKLLLGTNNEGGQGRQRLTMVARPYEPAVIESAIRALLQGRPSAADVDRL
jgi:CheY-like chemotaxis protein